MWLRNALKNVDSCQKKSDYDSKAKGSSYF